MKTDFSQAPLIILASSSPRRLDVLRANLIEPIIMPPIGEEIFPHHLSPEKAVMELALQKASSIKDKAKALYGHENFIIIGADTMVFLDRVIGKPKDREDAFNILSRLRGKEHYVTTGIALLAFSEADTEVNRVFYELTKVAFKNYTDEDIERYISTDEPYDKAGGYAIQGMFAPYIDYIEGDYDNVVGFPWTRIKSEIELIHAKEPGSMR